MREKRIIRINEDKCNGCGNCITNCHKGGIKIIDGIAKLVKSSFCGSFIDCIGECPTGALAIETKRSSTDEEVETLSPNAGCHFSGRYDINNWVS
ncbi:hypothetical protein JCM16358_09900 [Halanaerocella petrolearia]